MMRVEKTNKANAHYDEGGENKAKTHYNYEYEGREMWVWREKKDKEWGKEPQSGQGQKGIGMIFSIDQTWFHTSHTHTHTSHHHHT